MDRRSLLKGAGLGAATLAGTTIAAPALAQGKRELKLVTTWPKNFPGLGFSPERVAERVTAMTEGQLTIKVFAAGELVPAFESFDAVSTGGADMYHGAEYYWQGKSKAYPFFTAVPFGLTAVEMISWIYHQGGQELWDQLAANFNIKPFACGNTGVQMGGWFNKEINTIDDYRGLKIRMPGLGGEVLRKLGATAVALSGGEIFPALQSGNIDATEWVGPWNDLAFGFYKIAKFYYYPGFHEPGAQLALGVNLDVWNSLTKPQQIMIEDACRAENNYNLAEFEAQNTGALRRLLDEHGVQLKRQSDDILQEIGRVSGEVLREAAATDDITKQVFDSFLAARTNSMEWGLISEDAYKSARRLPFEF
ncbi:MAG: TRAP transporter substrate-binding protein [Pseudomonadota bacterium]